MIIQNRKIDRVLQDLYNFKNNHDYDKLQNDNNPSDTGQPLQILKSEFEKAINYLNNDKSPGIENVSS